ncbi:Nucleotide-binding universal stress protein, UspA family [Humidesulfovibrio mexicanus]|uniref:Nucleotide-binding universal stress protein, UspA family n=1 Tax=Humidesulfovibrio mexicanus TaxID=147047 RepID=A0A238Y5S9_9BACT|nr:universal stress protein [Humidesulfovibrio mexicanus]SNR66457.1 Nucleotide-binding universal stress protein, UspA family [Humidesulfovibrio mexicanus]
MLPQYRKILYATDLSATARQALRHVAALEERFDAVVTVLHVLPDPLELFSEQAGIDLEQAFGEDGAHWISQGEYVNVDKAMRQRLEAMAAEDFSSERSARHFAEAEIKIITGNPAEQILQEAEKGGYDLLVMGTHGHGRLLGLVLGSVAQQTIKNTKIPVLVVPLPELP